MKIKIIGVDCATSPKKIGFALGIFEKGMVRISRVTTGDRAITTGDRAVSTRNALSAAARDRADPVKIVEDWIGGRASTLIALDAPLGWPLNLANALSAHRAGEGIDCPADSVFRRATDRFIKSQIGKLPLDVGADRIARTAHSALKMLKRLREISGSPIPLAWTPAMKERIEAIEVYPAGTLSALGLPSSGYKKKADLQVRRVILEGLTKHLSVPDTCEHLLLANADLMDAVVCILAAKDFLEGLAFQPEEYLTAKKEGWIWVRKPLGH